MTTPDIAEARRLAEQLKERFGATVPTSQAAAMLHALAAEVERLRAQVAAAGWKLVPVEATVEMRTAGSNASDLHAYSPVAVWAAMLAASPAAPAQQAGDWQKPIGLTLAAPSLTVGDEPVKYPHPDEDDAVTLWAEIHRLRAAVQGPDGYATWQEAATAERVRRVKAEAALMDAYKAAAQAEPVAPLTLNEVRNLSAMQAGVPWTDDLLQALVECIKLYEQCAAADIRPFDPSDLDPQQHDAFWEHGELPWHGPAAKTSTTPQPAVLAEMREFAAAKLSEFLGPHHMALTLSQKINEWADKLSASNPPAQGTGELPPLPEPAEHGDIDNYYTADQMHAYARAALAQSPAAQTGA